MSTDLWSEFRGKTPGKLVSKFCRSQIIHGSTPASHTWFTFYFAEFICFETLALGHGCFLESFRWWCHSPRKWGESMWWSIKTIIWTLHLKWNSWHNFRTLYRFIQYWIKYLASSGGWSKMIRNLRPGCHGWIMG